MLLCVVAIVVASSVSIRYMLRDDGDCGLQGKANGATVLNKQASIDSTFVTRCELKKSIVKDDKNALYVK